MALEHRLTGEVEIGFGFGLDEAEDAVDEEFHRIGELVLKLFALGGERLAQVLE